MWVTEIIELVWNKKGTCVRDRDQTDRWIDPSVLWCLWRSPESNTIDHREERRKRQIIFAGMLTPTASAGLISIPPAQTLQECYCVSVRGASSWWAAMPAWKERQFHIWSGNLLSLTKTQRLAPSCIMLLIRIKYWSQTSGITKSNQLSSASAIWPY